MKLQFIFWRGAFTTVPTNWRACRKRRRLLPAAPAARAMSGSIGNRGIFIERGANRLGEHPGIAELPPREWKPLIFINNGSHGS
jgi:hypothetical protein